MADEMTPRERRMFELIKPNDLVHASVDDRKALLISPPEIRLTIDGVPLDVRHHTKWDQPVRIFSRLPFYSNRTGYGLENYAYFKYFPQEKRLYKLPLAAKRVAYLKLWGRLVAGEI